MASRYNSRTLAVNDDEFYSSYLKRTREIKTVRQFLTPIFKHPSAKEIAELQLVSYVWKESDRFFKLSHKYYGDSSLWWIIAWYNQKPTESHVKLGDVIFIPLPLTKILKILDV